MRFEIVTGPLLADGRQSVRANFWSSTGASSTQTCSTYSEAQGWVALMKSRDGRSKP